MLKLHELFSHQHQATSRKMRVFYFVAVTTSNPTFWRNLMHILFYEHFSGLD